MSNCWSSAIRATGLGLLLFAASFLGRHTRAAVPTPTDTTEVRHTYWIFFTECPDASTSAPMDRWTQPVEPTHLDRLRALGVDPNVRSRWFHAVSAPLSPSTRRAVSELPFVRAVRPVAFADTSPVESPSSTRSAPAQPFPVDRAEPTTGMRLGASEGPLSRINAIKPLERGLDGRGVRVGFLDAHFGGLRHEAFSQLRETGRLAGIRSFTRRRQSGNHGAAVVSVAAGRAPGSVTGPAHGATILAASTEFTQYERPIEEDQFVEGLEWLHRHGADVVNVSIGYTDFDDEAHSYSPESLDGNTALTTRAVDRAAQLGVTVVVSAGNSGCADPSSCWYYVNTPADADSVITVGAIGADSSLVPFSARGPTVDGRRKPDVVVQGQDVVAAWGQDQYARVGGTSFASPQVTGIVAQMLQVNPILTPMHIRRLLRQTASQAEAPDNERGWGVVNAEAAVRRAEWRARMTPPESLHVASPYRSRSDSALVLPVSAPTGTSTGQVSLIAPRGAPRVETRHALHPGPNWIRLNTGPLSPGVYRYVLQIDGGRRATGTVSISE